MERPSNSNESTSPISFYDTIIPYEDEPAVPLDPIMHVFATAELWITISEYVGPLQMYGKSY